MQFFIPLEKVPTTTHQQKQINLELSIKKGKPIFYEPESLGKARATLSAHLGQHVPDKTFKNQALHVTVKWLFPTKNKKRKDGEYKITKPDTHNLNKLLFDVMTDLGFWEDDALVASETIQKFWVRDSMPGIFIEIREIGD